MNDQYPEQSTAAMLAELLDVEKKKGRMTRGILVAVSALAAAVIIALLAVIPRTMATVNEARDAVNEARSAAEEVHTLASAAEESLGGIDVIVEMANTMVGNANQILEDNKNGMEEALDNFNSVDFDSLNKAIQDLQAVVEPLARLAKLF